MRLEDYKTAMESVGIDEEIKQSAYRKICRAAESCEAHSGIKYLRLPISAAAVIAVVLAGAVTVAAIGTGFFGLKQFFEKSV